MKKSGKKDTASIEAAMKDTEAELEVRKCDMVCALQ